MAGMLSLLSSAVGIYALVADVKVWRLVHKLTLAAAIAAAAVTLVNLVRLRGKGG